MTAKVVEGVNAMSRLAAARDGRLRVPVRRQRQPQMIAFPVGLDFESRMAIGRASDARAVTRRYTAPAKYP